MSITSTNSQQAEHQCHGYGHRSRGHSVEGVGPTPFLKSPKRFDEASNTVHHHCQHMRHLWTAIILQCWGFLLFALGTCRQQIKETLVASAMFPKFYLIQRNQTLDFGNQWQGEVGTGEGMGQCKTGIYQSKRVKFRKSSNPLINKYVLVMGFPWLDLTDCMLGWWFGYIYYNYK